MHRQTPVVIRDGPTVLRSQLDSLYAQTRLYADASESGKHEFQTSM
jgi:hypothetical protein